MIVLNRITIAMCLLLPAALPAAAQQVGTWRNYTSMTSVTGVAADSQNIWASTTGGMFRYGRATGQYRQFTNAEGLRSVNLSAITLDADGLVWTGSAQGYLHVYDPNAGTLRVILDIASAAQTDKQINALSTRGDTVLISTNFGLSIFKRGKFEFGDSFNRFGTIPIGTKVTVRSSIIASGKFWAAISDGQSIDGVASAAVSAPNLQSPLTWTIDQFAGASVICLASVGDVVFAGTTKGLFRNNGSTWSPVGSFADSSIVALASSSAEVFIATAQSALYAMTAAGSIRSIASATSTPTSIALSGTSVIVGTASTGVQLSGSHWTAIAPNGPASNQFSSVTVDGNGVVWAASGYRNGAGMYRYDGTSWISYTTANSALPMQEVYRVSTTPCNGSSWASIWGRGLVEFPNGTPTLSSTHIFNVNVGMVGIQNDLTYIVPSNVVCDSRGQIWTAIILPADKNILQIRKTDNTWVRAPLIYNGIKFTNIVDEPVDHVLAIDGSDNLWFTARDPAYKGVACLQNGGRIDSVVSTLITSANGLPSDGVQTVIVDRDNTVWVGTDRGIAIIVDPSNPGRSSSIAAYKPLLGVTINCIAIDPLNQKWVGTPDGVVVLSPDGTIQIASYSVESTNGKLIDNNVRSIAIDNKSGTVYFASPSGLASLTTTAASSSDSPDKLFTYPNPFRLPSAVPLTVKGLAAGSTIKILAPNGALMREVITPGGSIGQWDGLDLNGSPVASGVYFLIGYNSDGTVVKGKVAVIRTR
jgi:ligand-binding sensor domain-containing protein